MNLLQIDPKPAELKPAAPRPMQMGVSFALLYLEHGFNSSLSLSLPLQINQTSGGEDCEKKMFVGGISAGTTVENVRDYFVHTYVGDEATCVFLSLARGIIFERSHRV